MRIRNYGVIHLFNVFWLRDHYFRYKIYQPEQAIRNSQIVCNVNLAGMNSIVSNNSHKIKCLLYLGWQAFTDQ